MGKCREESDSLYMFVNCNLSKAPSLPTETDEWWLTSLMVIVKEMALGP